MGDRLYRVQDADGRGPFKPNFSHKWLDDERGDRDLLPPWTAEFGIGVLNGIDEWEHVGSGVRTIDGITLWFSPSEQGRLATLGYYVAAVYDFRVVAESQYQVLFASRLRLSRALYVGWPARREAGE